MVEFFGLFAICLIGAFGVAFFIHYFWQIQFIKAFGYAGFFIVMFLVFWASRLWENASRHYWGVLTPIFMGIIVASWLCVKFGPGIISHIKKRIEMGKRLK